ncbi:MAG: hypothetical protein KTR27_19325 [Leptolyngbyaceae cyanobacterium MAG.088]|nr:hypothetical protein [Leptolyngbyaceae cyanobacterium MAG.088]
MTIITAVQKDNEVAIACDTLTTTGGMKLSADYQVGAFKLIPYGDSILGLSGLCAVKFIFADLLARTEPVPLNSREDIFKWLLSHQATLKSDYFLKTDNGTDKSQPAETQWLHALLINPHGIFSIGRYREVNEFSKFWAIGSGRQFALGALEVLYQQNLSASEIAREAAYTATKFNPSCAEPITVETIHKYQPSAT